MDVVQARRKLLPTVFSDTWKSRVSALRVAALDLDDTLLTEEKEVAPETRRALDAWLDSGREIVIATGRPPRYARKIPEFLHCHPRICYNGAWLEHRQRVIYRNPIPAATGQKFMQQVLSVFPDLWIGYETDDVYYASGEAPHRSPIICDLRNLAKPAYKIIFRPSLMTEQQLRAVAHMRPMGTTWLRSDQYDLIQIAAWGTDKSTALRWWLETSGLSLLRALAVGDDTNDTGMLASTGMGVAMANAADTVKEAADFITLDNGSGGVAKVLNQVLTHSA